ncbi:MAG: glycosyltransferase family 2 protein [Chlorobium sp.]|jgi:chlorobactene glucosyltransferase|uniref:glycosyltransferase n=1 Tax=Chlorobium sp. TaxID=1095 RepID=UPI0025BE4183|nr:glycosyltransferase family 2 protein [Chlorobium sp.]MCF8215442.1 glycosyltransferase family 2 protein [Chlorobium sp.]MCF8270333.1 glycosyltransferase family 2 protein [Chlorobium sp.]MCF8286649.1 glycosyltransferase family 2 protein [Chlorobium sp.]MCF8290342.1 glycosyltransferase family 2 protein [Chlorobium sp.]MCF8384225.1 glycosyltransferase family 2 protein [Chlorobium sp.]
MLLLSYQIIVFISLLVFAGILLFNLFELSRLPEAVDDVDNLPLVSILVPARNEEENIELCVLSLLAQHYPCYEVIVLDDGSQDDTPGILRRIEALAGPQLRIVQGKPLPDGWHGKAWACQQLGDIASGELLLFTDADTRHEPDALFRSVTALRQGGADMLTLTPYQEMHGFWEKLVVPLIYFILMCYLPLRMVRTSPKTAFCSAIGQYILFRRDIYWRIGGHAAVKDAIVEDVWLCKAVKRAAGKIAIFNGTDVVSCRMYRTPGDIVRGFSKNLFAGLGYSITGLIALVVLTLSFHIIPYGFVAAALFQGDFAFSLFLFPLLQIMLAVFCRVLIAGKFRQPAGYASLHAFSQLALVAIALNSFAIAKFGKGPQWKGRNYRFSG